MCSEVLPSTRLNYYCRPYLWNRAHNEPSSRRSVTASVFFLGRFQWRGWWDPRRTGYPMRYAERICLCAAVQSRRAPHQPSMGASRLWMPGRRLDACRPRFPLCKQGRPLVPPWCWPMEGPRWPRVRRGNPLDKAAARYRSEAGFVARNPNQPDERLIRRPPSSTFTLQWRTEWIKRSAWEGNYLHDPRCRQWKWNWR